MKTIIAGSRTTSDAEVFIAMDACPWAPSTIISGCARGADRAGERWANIRGIPIERFPADWDTHGRAAGHIRNRAMADAAEALVLVWDGQSSGSTNMRDIARSRGLRIHEVVT